MSLKIALACDHAAYPTKEALKSHLLAQGFAVEDFGTHGPESVDYPEFAHPLALAVESGQCALGMAMCGSGNGINITLNKHQGIRSALCWTPELARLARQHNDANVLALPGRFVTDEEALRIAEAFLEAQFEGGRHQRRVDKIPL